MKEYLLDKVMNLMNNIDTYHRGDYSSLLDGIITNIVNKIKNVKTYEELPSDHHGISLTRSMKIKKSEETYLNIRNLKNYENVDMDSKVINHPNYFSTLMTDNVNEACENIINIVNDVLKNVAPIKKNKN